ncbi:MAG: glutamine--tRNA ligase/YqeY domain fusion protein [Oscillospiraceae bacterium]|nr:glutamine--tRNA ligase/YqeY domain fusion protein [Ruminococcus sp.]MDD7337289.1 glutamine--tRNA ligase/YqeY domain fusion protein [Ruminococcus sp.]MDY6060478.1 glutamine--tRNA ligase/YqeY domain fusion protein [Oscillospiraceae bacterium]
MEETAKSSNFIHDFIDEDLENGVNTRVQTRFPPEPNGYLHIGHAKAICINFSTAKKYNGICNLRLDDTNPSKEDVEYVDSIKEDIKWLGFEWKNCYYASSYFDFIYECAIKLIKKGKAYVDDLSPDEIREYRGTLTEPGKNSPYRERSVEENLELFKRMTDGEFPNGAKVLRAKIDMASPNLNMRDPIIYRISHTHHHQTGDRWCVYPMYDFAHPLSDAKEKVTYSLCSLEFENHRPLYNWFIDEIGFEEPPRQIEFARLNLNYCVTSKRKCLDLVESGTVSGWDDPRMVTLCGMRRRGYPPEAVRDFIDRIGVSKADSVVDYGLLEACVRDNLNANAPRAMAVLRPLKVVIDNYPEGQTETLDVEVHPDHPEMGTRKVTFGREIFVEREDFMIEPVKKYFRLFPGNEVRLKSAYFVKCTGYDLDENGEVACLHCTYDPASKGGNSPDGRKVKGTLHWVSKDDCVKAEVRLYDRLFKTEKPEDLKEDLNPDSLTVLEDCLIEGGIKGTKPGDVFQFMRQGYFCVDKDSTDDKLVINRTVDLKSSWGK